MPVATAPSPVSRQQMIQAMDRHPNEIDNLSQRVQDAFEKAGYFGPSLNFNGQIADRRLWQVSMLLGVLPGREAPPVFLKGEGAKRAVTPVLIDAWQGYRFYRYDFSTVQREQDEIRASYRVGGKKHHFHIPAYESSAKMLFSSCNGIQLPADADKFKERGGLMRMWKAIRKLHDRDSFHLNIFGGDQCYMDGEEEIEDPMTGAKITIPTGVLMLPSMREWLKLPDGPRNAHPLTDAMRGELEAFYRYKYWLHYFDNGDFSNMLGRVPSLSMSGDHDFYDGAGSYPDSLQNSPVMKGIYSIALEAYLIFQQHTTRRTPQVPEPLGLFGKEGYSFLRSFDGDRVAVLGVDTRTERTRSQVVSEESWNKIFDRLNSLPDNCEHLVVVFETPVGYPSLKKLGQMLESIEGDSPAKKLERFFLGKIPHFMNEFRLAELTDDVDDGWYAERHERERRELILRFIDFAKQKNIRVTFVGGDAHSATTSCIGSEDADPASDPSVIYNPISSAGVNTPPPAIMAEVLSPLMAHMDDEVSPGIHMRMIPLQKEGSLKTKILHNKRNFAVLRREHGNLMWRLFVEPKKGARVEQLGVYRLAVKALKTCGTTALAPQAPAPELPSAPSVKAASETKLKGSPHTGNGKRGRLASLRVRMRSIFAKLKGRLQAMRVYKLFMSRRGEIKVR